MNSYGIVFLFISILSLFAGLYVMVNIGENFGLRALLGASWLGLMFLSFYYFTRRNGRTGLDQSDYLNQIRRASNANRRKRPRY